MAVNPIDATEDTLSFAAIALILGAVVAVGYLLYTYGSELSKWLTPSTDPSAPGQSVGQIIASSDPEATALTGQAGSLAQLSAETLAVPGKIFNWFSNLVSGSGSGTSSNPDPEADETADIITAGGSPTSLAGTIGAPVPAGLL
jgi:hypothetical protein